MLSYEAEGLVACQLSQHQAVADNAKVEASSRAVDFGLDCSHGLAQHIEDDCDEEPEGEKQQFLFLESRCIDLMITSVSVQQVDVYSQEDD